MVCSLCLLSEGLLVLRQALDRKFTFRDASLYLMFSNDLSRLSYFHIFAFFTGWLKDISFYFSIFPT